MWIAVVTLFLGSLAIAEVGRRSVRGTLPRNQLVGLRVRRTLADDESWDVAHRASGTTLIVTGLLSTVLALAAGIYGTSADEDAAALALLAVTAVLLGGVLLAARQGLHALDERS